jgi:hypothetical protein
VRGPWACVDANSGSCELDDGDWWVLETLLIIFLTSRENNGAVETAVEYARGSKPLFKWQEIKSSSGVSHVCAIDVELGAAMDVCISAADDMRLGIGLEYLYIYTILLTTDY